MKRIFSTVFFVAIFQAVLQQASIAFFSRSMSHDELGKFFLAQPSVYLLLSLAGLGLPAAYRYYVGRYRNSASFLLTSIVAVIKFYAFPCAIFLLIQFMLYRAIFSPIDNIIIICYSFFQTIVTIYLVYFLSINKKIYIFKSLAIFSSIFILSIFIANMSGSWHARFSAATLVLVSAILYQSWSSRHSILKAFSSSAQKKLQRRMLAYGAPTLSIAFLELVIQQSDRVFIAKWYDISYLANFGLYAQISIMLAYFSRPIVGALEAAANLTQMPLQRLIRSQVKLAIVFFFISCGLLMLHGSYVAIFDISEENRALYLLFVLSGLLKAIYSTSVTYFLRIGQTGFLLVLGIVLSLSNIVLNFVFHALWGAEGIVLATCVVVAAGAIFLFNKTFRHQANK